MQKALKGFSHIPRTWSAADNKYVAKIGPGDCYVTKHDEVLNTVLGSCISVCIYDPVNKVGGMNHFMLPMSKQEKISVMDDTFRFGDQAMEVLINEVCKNGGEKSNLVYKAFGGGQMLQSMSAIGQSNIRFLQQFMKMENLELSAVDLGGPWPRQVKFFPMTGRAIMRKLEQIDKQEFAQKDLAYYEKVESSKQTIDDSELF